MTILRNGSPLRWVSTRAAVLYLTGGVTASLGLLALLGWALGLPRLASLDPRLIPMAPSTAALFVLFGLAIGLRARPSLGRRKIGSSAAIGGLIAAVAIGLFVLATRNIRPEVEHIGSSITAPIAGVPVGHMSPVTALCFLLASLSFLLSLAPRNARSWRNWSAAGGAVLVLGVSFVFLLSYCFGTPMLYGSEYTPPAASTILAFTTVGLGVLQLASPTEAPRPPALPSSPLSLATLGLGGMSVVAAGYFYYHSFEQQYRQEAERALLSAAELKLAELKLWHQERLSDGKVFFQNPAFAALVQRVLSLPTDTAARDELSTWLGNFQEAGHYDQWRLVDATGVTLLSMPRDLPALSGPMAQATAGVLRSRQSSRLDFYQDENNQQHFLQLDVPIFDGAAGRRPLGVLVLRISPASFLYSYIQRWPTPSKSAETILVRREEGDAMHLNALRFEPHAALALRVPLARTEVTAVRAALGETGTLQGLDYRGVPVLAAALPVPDTPWVLIAKMDSAEVNAPLRERLWATLLLVAVLLLGGGAGVGLIWRQKRVRHLQELLTATEALRESNALLSLYLEHSPIFTYIKTVTPTESRLLYASENLSQMTGIRVPAMIGRTMTELFPAEFAAKISTDDWAVVSSGQVLQLEESLNGRHYSTIKFPIVQGGRNLLAGYTIDITTRKLEEAQLRLRGAALEAAANAIVITNRTGAIEWVNSAFTLLSGWTLAESIGKTPGELVKSGEHAPAFYQQMWDTILAGHVWRGEIINRRKDGKFRTEDMTITPLRDERGAISHFIAIKQDITEHKTMETHFLQAQRMEAIGTLAGGIAHDLNNILAPVTIISGLLKARLPNPDDQYMLAIAQDSLRRGAEIIKQLLAFSRGQEGTRSLLQPRHLLNEMARLMSETFPREIDLKQQLPATLWPVIADPTQLHQVLMNLCVNARDAMPEGGLLTVSAANTTLPSGNAKLPPNARPGPYVMIAVSDTGHGIPPEIQHRVFDPFFTTKPIGKGTGLGLSTVLGLVQNHGGFVELESAHHEGSTFRVFLPAIPDEIAARREATPIPQKPALGGHSILVVDDEPNIRDSIRLLLEGQQYQVITAVHGEDGLTQYLRHRHGISLVITDIMMPVMDGATLMRALRAIDPGLKIITMSGLAEKSQGEDLLMPAELIKPFEGTTLLEVVRQQLSGIP